jgi:hypothetical protein
MQRAYQSNPLGPINRPLPANPALSPLDGEFQGYYFYGQPATIMLTAESDASQASRDYNYPVYVTTSSDPVVRVSCRAFGKCKADGMLIHIPAFAQPAGGTDSHMTIVQPDGRTMVNLWSVTKSGAGGPPFAGTSASPGALSAGWGGLHYSDGSLYPAGCPGDGTSCGANYAAGWEDSETAGTHSGWGEEDSQVYVSELAAGSISHALRVSLVCTGPNNANVWPMDPSTTSDSVCSGGNGVPYASRLWYDTNPNQCAQYSGSKLTFCDSLQALPRDVRTVLSALNQFGAFVGDTGGSCNGQGANNASGCGIGNIWLENQEPYWTYSCTIAGGKAPCNGSGPDYVKNYASTSAGWQLSGGRYTLAPNAAIVDYRHHLHVLDTCVTGSGNGPTC